MTPQNLFVATVATCLLNGMISPTLPVVWHLYPVWLPELLPPTKEVVYYGASLIVSTATLLLRCSSGHANARRSDIAPRCMNWQL